MFGMSKALALAVLILAATGSTARAQAQYPDRPVRMVVGFEAGGSSDIMARVIAKALSENLKQAVFVENHPGAGSMIGGNVCAHAAPDGYTICIGTIAFAIQAAINSKMPFDPLKDLTPIGLVSETPYVLVVGRDVPVHTIGELIAYARTVNGGVNVGSAGIGSGLYLAGEMFKSASKLDLVDVPFRGEGPAVAALLGGQVPMMFATITATKSLVDAGELRIVAVAQSKRLESMPDVPTFDESGFPGFQISGWTGLFVPRKTPQAVVEKLSQSLSAILRDPQIVDQFKRVDSLVRNSGPQEFSDFLAASIKTYKAVAPADIKH